MLLVVRDGSGMYEFVAVRIGSGASFRDELAAFHRIKFFNKREILF